MDESYATSEEGLAWPHDTPLTDYGVHLAHEVACELEELHEQVRFVAVASSPYRRCMQTAAEIARKFSLPVLIDQELGEVRDSRMPEHTAAHRSPRELAEMAKELGIKVQNPIRRNGGFKLFGKQPAWPETVEAARQRFIVRIENYIQQSAGTRRNLIIVTHADAVAEALVMFEREGVMVERLDFCARVIAQRSIKSLAQRGAAPLGDASALGPGVYADQWSVQCRAVEAMEVRVEALRKYHEQLYLETCEQTQRLVEERQALGTESDKLFDMVLTRLRRRSRSSRSSWQSQDDMPMVCTMSSTPPASLIPTSSSSLSLQLQRPPKPRDRLQGSTLCSDGFCKQLQSRTCCLGGGT